MQRSFYLDLAACGHRAPIGTHLVLHTRKDADSILLDGLALGGVVAETAERFHTPLAVPLMDLTLEKAALLGALAWTLRKRTLSTLSRLHRSPNR